MKCIDCDKVFLYPVVERDKETAMCPMCFGSNLSDVTLDELEFARRQQWYFNKPEPVQKASEVIDTRGKTDEEEPTEPEGNPKQYPSH